MNPLGGAIYRMSVTSRAVDLPHTAHTPLQLSLAEETRTPMARMDTESRLHTVGEVIDAHSRRLISSNEAWKLISFLLLDEIAPIDAASELSEQAELIADLRDGEWRRPDREERDAALAARIDDLKQYLARNY